MAKLLTIDLEKEYKLRIEDSTEIKTSFFKDMYKQAFDQVENIVKWSKESIDDPNKEIFSRESREYNNIIAFTGERGTGKSSAMLTVAKTLVEHSNIKFDLGNKESEYKFNAHFESLHTIDPSKFEKHQNIIEVILAELFEKFQTQIKDVNNQYNDNDKRIVLKAFQDVYQCLKVIGSGNQTKKYDGDALETLAKLADATKLERNIQSLIKEYLKFIHPNKTEDQDILIIPIDDFDLNVKHAGEMAEQIRKYLMIPQVMVLMAINLEQFGDVKTQDVVEDFKTLLNHSRLTDSPRDVAARYILKLIPIERRLLIPSLKIERNDVILKLSNGKEIVIEESRDLTLEKQIFEFIYINTGLYFVSKKDEYHTFLPYTLREFKTLCSVFGAFKKLDQLESILKDDDIVVVNEKKKRNENRIDIKRENLKLFENYFFNTWIKDYLLIPFQKMIFESSSILYTAWNKYFITSTVDILNKEDYKIDWVDSFIIEEPNRKTRYQTHNELGDIINRRNYPSNISLGDLIYFFSYLNRLYNNDKEIKRLFFTINCLYSIKLNSLNFLAQYNEIKDIVSGTIVNQYHEVIRDRDIINSSETFGSPQKNRIQFRLANKESYNKENYFLTHNILIKHDIAYAKYRRYREQEGFVFNKIYDDNFPNPTFNLFSFVYKEDANIFPLPYNNLELWQSILDNIDKDFKGKANDIVLVSNLFKQIWNEIEKYERYVEGGMKESFLSHSIIRLFLNEKDEFLYEKYEDSMNIPDWFSEIYEINKIQLKNKEVEIDKIIQECRVFIRKSKRLSSTKLYLDVVELLKSYNLPDKLFIIFNAEANNIGLFNLTAKEYKQSLYAIFDKILDEQYPSIN